MSSAFRGQKGEIVNKKVLSKFYATNPFTFTFASYCWFYMTSKIQTKKLSMLQRFYFHDVLEQLKTNLHTIFASKWFLVLC